MYSLSTPLLDIFLNYIVLRHFVIKTNYQNWSNCFIDKDLEYLNIMPCGKSWHI